MRGTAGHGLEGAAHRAATNAEDRRIQCVDCGEEFLFTAGEQAFYREHNLTHAPTRCKRCRANRKGARSADDAPAPRPPDGPSARELHRAVCSNCGSETRVPFVPTASRPVYCRNCYAAHRPPRGDAPRAQAQRSSRSGAPDGGASGRMQGVVKWFNQSKGFGFIRDDAGQELFVHSSAVQADGLRTLSQGDRVEFDVVPGAKGNQAANLTRIG